MSSGTFDIDISGMSGEKQLQVTITNSVTFNKVEKNKILKSYGFFYFLLGKYTHFVHKIP